MRPQPWQRMATKLSRLVRYSKSSPMPQGTALSSLQTQHQECTRRRSAGGSFGAGGDGTSTDMSISASDIGARSLLVGLDEADTMSRYPWIGCKRDEQQKHASQPRIHVIWPSDVCHRCIAL